MKIEKVEVEGFRALKKEVFSLNDLTVFSGEMGSGKTSRLLSILFNLSGSAPSGINLDEMINVDRNYMWVKTSGDLNGRSFFIERSKRIDRSSVLNTNVDNFSSIKENILIEGRELAKLFLGAPSEKALRIDSLLGLSKYNQIASEISIAYLEQRILYLRNIKNQVDQTAQLKDNLSKTELELTDIGDNIKNIMEELSENYINYSKSEDTIKKFEEYFINIAIVESKKKLIKEYYEKLKSIPEITREKEETTNELKARYDATQKRIAFLEAVMQILDMDRRNVEDISTCPICGALISATALDKFVHFDKEYRHLMNEMIQLEVEWNSMSETFEQIKNSKNQIQLLKNQINNLQDEIAALSLINIPESVVNKAKENLKRKNSLLQQERELQIKKKILEEQEKGYRALYNEFYGINNETIEKKIVNLHNLRDQLLRIKNAIIETINEFRINQAENLRNSFRENFQKIYPYDRFNEVDFDFIKHRGKDLIQVKGKIADKWIYPNQMSTGENVAISFALLFAANKLDSAPILLFDEPEEGLDENGIEGLAHILKNLKEQTQIVVATRNIKLANILNN